MKLNESETRQQIIDKRLSKAGWNVKDPSEVTEELDIVVDLLIPSSYPIIKYFNGKDASPFFCKI